MSLYKARGVFVSILLLRLVYLLSVTIQAPLGSESLGIKFDTEGFDDLFYAEEATYCSRKSLVFFASSLHTHPAYTSDNMHSPYVVLQIGLCHAAWSGGCREEVRL